LDLIFDELKKSLSLQYPFSFKTSSPFSFGLERLAGRRSFLLEKAFKMAGRQVKPITKPPLLQRSRLTGGGSPNLVGLVERKSL